jgi:ribonuclease P protein component
MAALCLPAGVPKAATNSRSAMSRPFAAPSNRRFTHLVPSSRLSAPAGQHLINNDANRPGSAHAVQMWPPFAMGSARRVHSGNVTCAAGRRFTRSRRVIRSSEFRNIYESGVRMTSRYFAAFCLHMPGESVPSRFGFTVPKTLGKAVQRNRLKRRMREAVRSQFDRLPANWAIVFNPRRSVLDAPFEDLCREVGRLFARCKEC